MFVKIVSFIFFVVTATMTVIAGSVWYNQHQEVTQHNTEVAQQGSLSASTSPAITTKAGLSSVSVKTTGIAQVEKQVAKKVSAPAPLVHNKVGAQGELVSSEVLKWTNSYRTQEGVKPLSRNALLDSAAILKMDDMFKQRYFEHVSPSGQDISGLAKSVNYDYIVIGENLALGDFENEKALVDAWMASPGHRANILKNNFEEIGIAVGKGNFAGRITWIAVQEFGKPASSCPSIPKDLSATISVNEKQVLDWKKEAGALHAEIDAGSLSVAEYFSKVEEYNTLVAKINLLIDETSNMIAEYNTAAKEFNTCVGE